MPGANWDRVNDARTIVSDANRYLKEVLEQEFLEGCRDLFDRHPALQTFSWTQHYDYDDCLESTSHEPNINGLGNRFEATELSETTTVVDGEIVQAYGPSGRTYRSPRMRTVPNPDCSMELIRAERAVCDFLLNFSSEDVEQMFQTGVRVVVDRTGPSVHTEPYHV